jgi:hypothetical protein
MSPIDQPINTRARLDTETIADLIDRIANAKVDPTPEDAERVLVLLSAVLTRSVLFDRFRDLTNGAIDELGRRIDELGGAVITARLLDELGVDQVVLRRKVKR